MKGRAPCGRVYLVGAGPGDPELLTLKAVRALGEADVVLHDYLIDCRVLAHVRPDARIIAVGKRGGCRSTPQAFIERLIVREARAGRVVVRLKGGDPMVFGRGGEELAAVRAAGIGCELVSGVTAAIAAAAAAAVPLTHRAHASGVVLVTGHEAQGHARVDWKSLVATGMTLVIYMGVARSAGIRDALLAAGLSPATPIAIVERASCRDERVLHATVGALGRTIREPAITSPAVFIVGDVAAARDAIATTPPRAAASRRARRISTSSLRSSG
jgi:uroporphyrin-III C-methyltransferase